MIRGLLIFILLCFGFYSWAQRSSTPLPSIQIQLTDAATGAAVPFVSGYFKRSKTGNAADETGKLTLTVGPLPDTLLLSEVGYETVTMPLSRIPADTIRIKMKATTGQLQEVVVTGFRDPGKALMHQIIAHKRTNDPQRLNRWMRNGYVRTEVDIENLSTDQRQKLMRTMLKVYQHYQRDSVATNALPIFFREQYWREFHTRLPQSNAVYLVAEQNLGLKTDGLAPKLDRFNVPVNLYDGVIPILKQSFVGPVSDLGLAYYAFAIPDTLVENGNTVYRLKFQPKRRNENTFEGSLWVDAGSYALRRVEIQTSSGANLNFIQSLLIRQAFMPVDDTEKGTAWAVTESSLNYQFQNGLGLLGLPTRVDSTGRTLRLINTSVYDHYQINPPGVTAGNFSDTDLAASSTVSSQPFKEEYRLQGLTGRELAIYRAADSLKKNEQFRRTTRLAAFIASGYWDVGNRWRFGPLSSLLSSNLTEGMRFRTSVWSMEGINPHWSVWGYLAYGTRDRRFKETVGIKYVPSRTPYRKYELTLKNDYDALVEYDDQLDNDNLFTLALRKPIPVYQNFLRQIRLSHERDLSPNWSVKTYLSYGSMAPTFRFSYAPSDDIVNTADSSVALLHTLTNSEAGLYLRYARNERTTFLNYDKLRVFTRYPIWQIHVAGGVPFFKNTYFDYLKFSLSLSQDLPMPLKGNLYYNLTSGAVLGTVPLLLLHIPRGNPYYIADKYAYYGMSPYEFAADRYVSLLTRYSLGGLILNKIPLLNRFNLRERLTANFFWGDLTAANQDFNQVNPFRTTGRTPYAEAGVGIENIFNLFSVDCIWRLNHLTGADAVRITRFGIYTGVRLQF
ncbi:DUF5686 family protein [Larkinella sp. C7]|uniref:DUF5686 family protein n=1 Tax=Larkinella sp. C7 TaxID=2576607 RepID=UPI00111154C2|nr:DUF5686 family protein [Larkinella sp. C7]